MDGTSLDKAGAHRKRVIGSIALAEAPVFTPDGPRQHGSERSRRCPEGNNAVNSHPVLLGGLA